MKRSPMLRNALIVTAVSLTAGLAHAQAVGDPCTSTGDTAFGLHCSETGTLLFCATDNTVQEQDCTFPDPDNANTPINPNGSCGAQSCTDDLGDGCTALGVTGQDICLAGSGEVCSGISVWFNDDTTDDNSIGFPSCENDAGCVISGDGETCNAAIPACTTTTNPLSCNGDTIVVCIFGGSEDDDGSGAINGTEDQDGDGTVDSFILPAAFGLDCATAFNTASSCDETLTDGPMHQALIGLGINVAGQPLADCDLPAEGEGEGEGEGDAAEGEGEGDGRGDEEGDGGGSSSSCNQSGASFAGVAGLLGLAIVRRRRA
jgi:hypothetical protein